MNLNGLPFTVTNSTQAAFNIAMYIFTLTVFKRLSSKVVCRAVVDTKSPLFVRLFLADSSARSSQYSLYTSLCCVLQRWSRGHKARGQGQRHKKNPRPRPRTDTLEAKDRNARGQGLGPRTQAQVLSKKKKVFTKTFQAISKKKKGLHKNFSSDLHKKTFSKKFFKRSTKF